MNASSGFDPSYFNFKPHDFVHRKGYCILRNEPLGLIRELVLRFDHDDDGNVIPFITVLYVSVTGEEHEIAYEQDEVGFLDLGVCLSPRELLDILNGFRADVELYGQFFGPAHQDTIDKKSRYDALIQDLKKIMCANQCFTLQAYESIVAQHFLTGLA